MKTFETERLTMKLADLEDADFFLELYNLPSFIKHIGDRNIRTKEDAEQYIKTKFRPHIEKLGYGNYVVIHKELKKKLVQLAYLLEMGLKFQILDSPFFLILKVKVLLMNQLRN